MKKVILASQSPRRAELIQYLPVEYEIISADIDETFANEMTITENIMRIAYKKAAKVKQLYQDNDYDFIISADTAVCYNDIVMGKPKDEEDAHFMLKTLSGDTHSVYTGICVLSKEKTLTFYEETLVTFRSLTDEEILNYIATKEPMDKAGAYGIQGYAKLFVEEIRGNYENVIGLPIAKLYEVLKTKFSL